MIAEIVAWVVGILLIIAALFSFIAAIGILRLPDLYTRMHAASKAGTMGSGLALVAIAIYAFDPAVSLRALAGVLFLLLTAPVATHLLARAAYTAGYRPTKSTHINDLDPKGRSTAD